MRLVVALFARKSISPGCWPRQDKKFPLVCREPQPNRRVSVLILRTALISVGSIESSGGTARRNGVKLTKLASPTKVETIKA